MEPSERTGISYAAPIPKRDQRKTRLHMTIVFAVFALLAILILTVSVVAAVARKEKEPISASETSDMPSPERGSSEEPSGLPAGESSASASASVDTPSESSESSESSETGISSEIPSEPSSSESDIPSDTSSEEPSDASSADASSAAVSEKPQDKPSDEPSETEPEVVTSFYAYTKPIPYKTVYKETDEMDEGDTKVEKAGVEGEMKYTVKQIFTNGELTYEDVWSEDVMKKPVDEIVLKGTRRNITYDQYTYKKTVEYKTEYKYDTTIPEGSEIVEQEGKNGEVQYTVKQTFVNGKLTDEDVISEDVLTKVQNKIVRKGVGGVYTTDGGKKIPYSYEVSVRTTCYYGGETGGKHSATGKDLAYGMIAVDPDVIPLQSKLYIDFGADGYDGYFTAEDIGGGIKGNIIDVYFPSYSDAKAFNAKNRTATVYILSNQ